MELVCFEYRNALSPGARSTVVSRQNRGSLFHRTLFSYTTGMHNRVDLPIESGALVRFIHWRFASFIIRQFETMYKITFFITYLIPRQSKKFYFTAICGKVTLRLVAFGKFFVLFETRHLVLPKYTLRRNFRELKF